METNKAPGQDSNCHSQPFTVCHVPKSWDDILKANLHDGFVIRQNMAIYVHTNTCSIPENPVEETDAEAPVSKGRAGAT